MAGLWDENQAALSEGDKRMIFYNQIIKPTRDAMNLGVNYAIMMMKNGAHFPMTESSHNEEVPAPKKVQPAKPIVNPPNSPRQTTRSTNNPLPPTNTLYLARLPAGINANPQKVLETLFEALHFPSDLRHANITVRPYHSREAFLEGPEEDPLWATKMITAKKSSELFLTDIHMNFGRPRPLRSSPGRSKKVAEVAARLARVVEKSPPPSPRGITNPEAQNQSIKTPDPPQASVMTHHESANQQRLHKRSIEGREEGRERLFKSDKSGMDLSLSPDGFRSPQPKQMNTRSTPFQWGIKKVQSLLSPSTNRTTTPGTPHMEVTLSPIRHGSGDEDKIEFDDAAPSDSERAT